MASDGGAAVLMDPSIIYFTFSRIRPKFSCGRTVAETIAAIQSGALDVAALPRITVLSDGRHFYSLNNRRLYVFKTLKDLGLVSAIPVRLKPVPQTKRMIDKYTPDKCSLSAKLMREGDRDAVAHHSDDNDGCSEEEPLQVTGGGGGGDHRRNPSSCSSSVQQQTEAANNEGPSETQACNSEGACTVATKGRDGPACTKQHAQKSHTTTAPRKKGMNDLANELAALHGGADTSSDEGTKHSSKKSGKKKTSSKRGA